MKLGVGLVLEVVYVLHSSVWPKGWKVMAVSF